jgi:hypothetical protein
MSEDQLSPEASELIATVRAERTLSKAARERSYARIGVGIGVTASGVFTSRTVAGAGSSAGAPGITPAAAVVTKWWVLGGLLVMAGAAGLGGYIGSRAGDSEKGAQQLQAPEGRVRLALPPDERETPKPAPLAPAPAPAPEQAVPEHERTPLKASPVLPPVRGSSRSTSAAITATTAEEVMLLSKSRASLRSNPANALALATRHERDYPRSQLAAERQVVMILALCELGRTSEARRKSAALASRSPALTALEGTCAERR